METKEIRLANLVTLANKYKRIVDFCDRINMAPSYFSQLKSGRKSIGDEIARKVEISLGLHRGYLDVLQQQKETAAPPENEALGIAYAVESLPGPLREQFKKLVYQVAAYCVATPEQYAMDVGPFKITEESHVESNQVTRQKSL